MIHEEEEMRRGGERERGKGESVAVAFFSPLLILFFCSSFSVFRSPECISNERCHLASSLRETEREKRGGRESDVCNQTNDFFCVLDSLANNRHKFFFLSFFSSLEKGRVSSFFSLTRVVLRLCLQVRCAP